MSMFDLGAFNEHTSSIYSNDEEKEVEATKEIHKFGTMNGSSAKPTFGTIVSVKPPFEIGVDEAGCGPLIGPVTVASAHIPNECKTLRACISCFGDSKQLGKSKVKGMLKRTHIVKSIDDDANVLYCKQAIQPSTIDRMNILSSRLYGMQETCKDVVLQIEGRERERGSEVLSRGFHIVIDGTHAFPDFQDNVTIETMTKADVHIPSVSIASYIAKELHDNIIMSYDDVYPEISKACNWSSNMGYPSRKHQTDLHNFIMENGYRQYLDILRVSYSPVQKTIREYERHRASAVEQGNLYTWIRGDTDDVLVPT